MNRTPRRLKALIILPLIALIVFSGCVSAAKLLEKAEKAWTLGQYSEAIGEALDSYEKAVDKNKNQTDIDSAKDFLFEKFPIFNENLSKKAEQQLNGTDSDKAQAWETYQELVNMNTRVGNSIAASFLETEDYSQQLQKAKEIAAQIYYVEALELMGGDQRSMYIEAAGLLKQIDSLVSGYRDVGTLLKTCYEEGTVIVAFSDRNMYFKLNTENNNNTVEFSNDINMILEEYIGENDYPDFLQFMSAGSVKSAGDAGAVLFIDYQGDIWINSK
ncbi:MAG: hypothetical protein KAH21_01900, partial [Spirochaetaceae bacterium]|nr:hypothetical protein [Spirochaetaceae bacterium]